MRCTGTISPRKSPPSTLTENAPCRSSATCAGESVTSPKKAVWPGEETSGGPKLPTTVVFGWKEGGPMMSAEENAPARLSSPRSRFPVRINVPRLLACFEQCLAPCRFLNSTQNCSDPLSEPMDPARIGVLGRVSYAQSTTTGASSNNVPPEPFTTAGKRTRIQP